jgi:ribosome biogenesis GTPase
MASRKLTKQQQSRIAAKQSNDLIEASELEGLDQTALGLVISHFGQQLEIEPLATVAGQGDACATVRCFQRTNLPQLVTGDRVRFKQNEDETGIVLAVEPRKNEFLRPGFKGKLKPVAANIDKVILVIAVLPEPFTNLIDRYLTAIESLNLNVLIVFNKTDLITHENHEHIDNMMAIYTRAGYDVIRVSATDGAGIAELENALAGQTTVLVGQSGVGKSSLVNRLGGELMADVGGLSIGKEKGTHTTTTARLFHLNRFDVIDSPGIREFNLGHISTEQLIQGYPELFNYARQCKFRDCSHRTEPECALQAALEDGLISAERLNNYFQILASQTE